MDSSNGVEAQQLCDFVEKNSFGSFSNDLLIHGENLKVLTKLRNYYRNQVKCIYIDPPYNTCNEFEYFKDFLTHDEWLNMMKPRLKLLWEFLSTDGTIWISIDDEECHYLKVLCDDLWGRDKFVTMLVRQKNADPRNYKRRKIIHMQDYVLVYCKDVTKCQINEVSLEYFKKYIRNDGERKWVSDSLLKRYLPEDGERYLYKIVTPSGRELYPPYGRQWSVDVEEFEQLYKNSQLWFGELNDEYPCRKCFTDQVEKLPPTSLWTEDMVGSNQEARVEISAFNQHEFFYVPKPERFIQLILEIATDENDLVLDAFLGSGTTAAVAMKMRRHWIGIEKGVQCEEFCLPRLKAVIEGDPGGISSDVNWKGGSGFRYLCNTVE